MIRADVVCIQCRRRKIACSKTLPHCTECLVHGRDCCYSRDKRRRIGDNHLPQAVSAASASTSNPPALLQQSLGTVSRLVTSDLPPHVDTDTTTDTVDTSNLIDNAGHDDLQFLHESASASSVSSNIDLVGSLSDAVNDPFWWLASQWQLSLAPDPLTQAVPATDPVGDLESAHVPPSTTTPTSVGGLASNTGAHSRSSVANHRASSRLQPQAQSSDQLHRAYKRCLPEPSRWPQLFRALKRLCQTAYGGSEADQSPFLCLSKLRNQLELDVATDTRNSSSTANPAPNAQAPFDFVLTSTVAPDTAPPHRASVSYQKQASIAHDSDSSSFQEPDTLRRAWTLSALCLASSASTASPIELPARLGMQLDHQSDGGIVLLFSVAWAHCRTGLRGDPIEVMQTYRMMSLAFSRCLKGHELASVSVFLGCRAAATMSIHRSGTIAGLGSSVRQQEALNAFWHLVSQGCHFQAWKGKDMPIDLGLVDLAMPNPTSSLQAAQTMPGSVPGAGDSPRSQLLSSSPVFMTRIWTSVAIGQTIERHYRQGATLVVPCETRLEVAVPTATRPSQSEQDHVLQTAKALDYCASLLQTRGATRAESKDGQLKRFVLMLVRYSRVLLHYPFCRVDRDHRRAAQDSISAIISTVLGTLLSLASESAQERRADIGLGCDRPRHVNQDDDSDGYTSTGGADEGADARGSIQTRTSRSLWHANRGTAEPTQTSSATMDRHLLELLAGMSVRALVFTMALIDNPSVLSGSEPGSHDDDSERQRSDAVLAVRALEQLHLHGVVSRSLLDKACKIVRQSGDI